MWERVNRHIKKSSLTQTGFTIVELLIVVVVIAILAAITIISYNGIQKRAQTAVYASVVDDVEKLLMVAAVEGTIDVSSMNLGTCYGQPQDYPARDGFAEGECFYLMMTAGDGSPIKGVSMRTQSSGPLSSVVNRSTTHAPQFSMVYRKGSYNARGIYIVKGTGDNDVMIVWYVLDGTSCGRSKSGDQQAAENVAANAQYLTDFRNIRDGVVSAASIEAKYGFAAGSLTEAVVLQYITLFENAAAEQNQGSQPTQCMRTVSLNA